MKYIIHACNKRMWYVEEFLIPSMLSQGIQEKDVSIHLDTNYSGCLFSTMENFLECGRKKIDAWHLQDDIAVSRDFAYKTKLHNDGIVFGFWHQHQNEPDLHPGRTRVEKMGYSFPCIRLDAEILLEFAEWFYSDAMGRDEYQSWIDAKKYVDSFFRDFMQERHKDEYIYNLKPSIVEHVDWLIGGSTINKWRPEICRAKYWEDESVIDELKDKLAHRK